MNNVALCIQSIILFICRAVLFIIMVYVGRVHDNIES